MAVVDLKTGKITGCEEGSKVWWHEQGHIVFNDSEHGSKIEYYQQHFMMMSVFSMSVGVVANSIGFKLFSFLCASGMVLSYIYQELWCWMYAKKHYNR